MIFTKLKIKNWKLKILAKQSEFTRAPKSLVRGFTVLESIVAIAVLSLSISGAFSAIQQSLSQSTIAKDEVTAFYLAQEAAELIRNKRDTNQLIRINTGAGSWLDGITNAANCPFNQVCLADATNGTLTFCGTSWANCTTKLKQNQSTFLYGYVTGNDTNFVRQIMIESIDANQIAVIVRVFWSKGLVSKDFKFKTLLFNWLN